MMEFGKTLRTAREAKGLTTGQIAERTHMMVQVVEGLENEDFSKIVAPIYGRGFVKLYCETVGLEPKPLVDAFMEIYSGGRGKSAAPHEPAKPEPRQVEPAAPESPPKPIAPPPKPVAPEPPQRVQETIDFSAPPAAETPRQQPTTSRYAAPMPIDDGFSMPAVNWRMVALGAAAVAIVVLALLGVRALYRVTMTAPEEETTEVAAPAPDPTPAPTDARAPAKAPVDRKPLPLKPFYIDSNHQTETENK
ncbi:MAG: helix-turn-helix domain-containing protein [Kiritimatiellae bacterium]|nr:helix-turn-helix domain-containing protein [Kiritimatiellia bacterium]